MPEETVKKNGNGERLNLVPPEHVLFGLSKSMAEVRNRAQKICRTNIPILLCGEGGTGKEALARWIHVNSEYSAGEFVKVNCAAIPGTLLESELFGYEKGAFTGALQSKPGRVELAHRGTLFLDEIADLDLDQRLWQRVLPVVAQRRYVGCGGGLGLPPTGGARADGVDRGPAKFDQSRIGASRRGDEDLAAGWPRPGAVDSGRCVWHGAATGQCGAANCARLRL